MNLVFFDSLLWTEWITFTLSVGISGFFVLFKDNFVPESFKRIYKYGKAADLHKKSLNSIFELPKSWFYHFYLFAAIFYSYLLLSLVQVYIFGMQLPKLTEFLLDSFVSLNRIARVPSESAFLCMVLLLVQVTRRLTECFLVSVYSNAKINFIHYLFGISFYFGVGLSVLAEADGLNHPETFGKHLIDWRKMLTSHHLISILMFMIASYIHNQSHRILANLRRDKNGNIISYKHEIPNGGLFEYVSCPHFLAEILIYISLNLIQAGLSYTWWLVMCFVVTNQLMMGLTNHYWYLNKFEHYPHHRKAVIPFII